ncbi:MAG TPA: adenylate/guanylate cyclase domain-containing protein, partial [Candidatus Dormibacteraeota bacterium]|nr:adenylate/guanylate cyclase domain-containing protein [Candidatus Dormibacteraeota bacterium]
MEEGAAPGASERRIVTILFADLVGFTSLAEGLDPDDLAIVQDAYFATVREVCARYRGRLEKFIGDAAVATFGVPTTADDDVARAVAAGLALTHAVGDLGARLGLSADELRLRVGINTGEVSVAMGGPDAGRVTGDPVNVAARLQTAAEPGTVLLGEVTALAVEGAVELGPVQVLQLKGKEATVRARRALAMRADASREAAMGRLRAPLRGRAGALDTVAAAAARAAAGEQVRVLIVAPPGVGKTRLLAEARATLADRVGMAVTGLRVRPEEPQPFAIVEQLLRGALEAAAPGPLDKPAIRAAVAGACRRAGGTRERADVVGDSVLGLLGASSAGADGSGASDVSADPGADDRTARFVAWNEALAALAGAGTAAWLIEDLHWAGTDALDFLDVAAAAPGPLRTPGRPGRVVIATARPALLERLGSRPSGPPEWQVLHLPTLASGDAEALVHDLAGDALPAGLVAHLVERSDGNCLFIEEVLRMWIGLGVLREDPGGRLELAVSDQEVPLPATVQAVYAAQLDDLPPPARAAARRGSVSGRRVPRRAMAALGIEAAEEALTTLLRRAFFSGPQADPLLGEEYTYRHALLHDAGYASLGRSERAALHARLADWLASVAADDAQRDELAGSIGSQYAAALAAAPALASTIAEGRDRSQLAQQAAMWLERAATHAMRLTGYAAAADALRQAAELTPADDVLALARRSRLLGSVLAQTQDLAGGAAMLERATALGRSLLDGPGTTVNDRTAARSEYAAAAAAWSAARYEQLRFAEATQIADEALSVLGEAEPHDVPLLLARIRGREGTTNAYAALADEAAEVVAQARAAGDLEGIFEARRVYLALSSSVSESSVDDWLGLHADAIALRRWPVAVGALVNAGSIAAESDPDLGSRLLGEAASLAAVHGLDERLAWIHQANAELHFRDGQWAQSIDEAEAALELGARLSLDRVVVRTWFVLTAIAAARSDGPR